MIKTLISIRLRSMLSGVTNRKKNGAKPAQTRAKTVGFVLIYLYVIAVFAFLFTSAALAMSALVTIGLDGIYFAVFTLLTFSVVFILSIFETKSELFECKDNELLLSMPIKPRHIVISRIFTILIFNYAEAALVMLPCIVVYLIKGGGIVGALGAVIASVFLPLLATALASGVGYLVALLSRKLKRNSFVTVLISLLFLAVYFVAYNFFLEAMTAIEENSANVAEIMKGFGALLYIGEAVMLHYLWTPIMVCVCVLASYVAYRVISHGYLKIVTDRSGAKRKEYKAERLNRRGAFFALVIKEMRTFVSSATYMLNAGLGVILVVAIGVLGLIKAGELSLIIDSFAMAFPKVDVGGTAYALISSVLVLVSSMIFISAAALSLEGKKLWILKTMPLDARTVLFSKAMPHIIITAPATLLASIMLGVAMGAPIEYWPFIILTPIASTVALAFMGISINTAFPKFEFEHETQPIKQSLATFLAMVGSTVVAVLSIALTVLVSVFFSPLLAAGAVLALSLLLAGGFAFLVAGPCARKYDTYCA